MGYFTHSMGSWVWSPQARRSMFMTIPEKYKLWSVVLWSKNFEKLVRFFFEKIFSSKNFHWISEQKYFFDPHFREKKSRKYQHFAIFSLSKMLVEKLFCSEIQWKIFEENIFSKKKPDQLFEIFGTDHQALKLIFFGDGHEHQPASLWGPNSTSHAVREISHILLNNNTVAQNPTRLPTNYLSQFRLAGEDHSEH